MDMYENRIREILTKELEVPNSYNEFIDKVLNGNLNYKKQRKRKVVTLNLVSIFLLCGVATAGVEVYKGIWKTPNRIENYYDENTINGLYHSKTISQENIMDEKQAEERAKEILKRFDASDEKIKNIELIDNPSDDGLFYRVNTENESTIDIDAKASENFIMYLNKVSDNMQESEFSKEIIIEKSKKIAEKYNLDFSKYDNVEITYDGDDYKTSKRFSIYYRKTYNGVINNYEELVLGIIPSNEELYYVCFINRAPENTNIKVSKEQAIEIATKKEKEINNNHEIINIETNMAISKMNGYAYLREKEYEKYLKARSTENYPLSDLVYYRVEDRIRQVWKIKFEYSPDMNNEFSEDEFTYFIDTETGEIVGGE